jgi:hypothetical protein
MVDKVRGTCIVNVEEMVLVSLSFAVPMDGIDVLQKARVAVWAKVEQEIEKLLSKTFAKNPALTHIGTDVRADGPELNYDTRAPARTCFSGQSRRASYRSSHFHPVTLAKPPQKGGFFICRAALA